MKSKTPARPNNTDPPRHAPEHSYLKNFLYASYGIRYAWRNERNFRLEIGISGLVIVSALLLEVNLIPIVLCCALVISLELINTALEAIVDLVSPTYHPLARIAKDVAAGAVLISSLASLIIGLYLFIPAIIARVSSP